MTAPVSASAPRRFAVLGASRIPCTLESWADLELGKTRFGNSEPLGSADLAGPTGLAGLAGPNVRGSSLAAGQPFAAAGAAAVAIGARIVATLAKLADGPGTPT